MRISILLATVISLVACSNNTSAHIKQADNSSIQNNLPEKQDDEAVAYFASGCFWCVEEVFESIIGVREVISGYAGGNTDFPTYKTVSSGNTGHAESVMIYYDPQVVSFDVLVDAFFASHDPTTMNRQGPDSGSQYRSIAFYSNEKEKQAIEEKIKALNEAHVWSKPIVTEVKKIDKFWPAEGYHQDYARLNVGNPYIKNVSIPRYNKFVENFDSTKIKKTNH